MNHVRILNMAQKLLLCFTIVVALGDPLGRPKNTKIIPASEPSFYIKATFDILPIVVYKNWDGYHLVHLFRQIK